jgi:hypothetical protein
MNDKIQKVKSKLLEFGYIDNEWLDKYLEVLEANLDRTRVRKSTQAHHAIPVNSYWTSDEPYNRKEALKLSRLDQNNFEVHLLYKDHLLIHSYLTLCTDLESVQQRYEAQAALRKANSAKNKDIRQKAAVVASKNKLGKKYNRRDDNKRLTPVVCLELNKTFRSISDAAEELNINKNCILSCLAGRTKTAGHYHWSRAQF